MFKLNGQQLYTGWIVINLFHIKYLYLFRTSRLSSNTLISKRKNMQISNIICVRHAVYVTFRYMLD